MPEAPDLFPVLLGNKERNKREMKSGTNMLFLGNNEENQVVVTVFSCRSLELHLERYLLSTACKVSEEVNSSPQPQTHPETPTGANSTNT